jgi:pimeloyl-ACP methyl ester carboxylesterase
MTKLKVISRVLRWSLMALGVVALGGVGLLAVPLSRPPELASIHAGGAAIDRTGLPEPSRFQARDGSALAYRLYPAADGNMQKIAIAIHGSSGGSSGMNEIAKRLAAENITVVAPDIRGHGGSGTRGDIGYLGQLDDDLADLVAELRRQHPGARFALLGFSAGGGFALRATSESLATAFDRVVLLSPYLGYDAVSTKSPQTTARWADADIPRFVAITLLQQLGLSCCEALPVIAFAVPQDSEKILTPRYSYRLLANFAAPRPLDAAFHRLSTRTTIIAAGADELMNSDKYAEIVAGITPKIEVKILPGLSHMDMLHAPAAIEAIAATLKE